MTAYIMNIIHFMLANKRIAFCCPYRKGQESLLLPLWKVSQRLLTKIQCTPLEAVPYKGRMFLSDILGRRRPTAIDFVRESYPIRGGTL
jgi:hypothetical protein